MSKQLQFLIAAAWVYANYGLVIWVFNLAHSVGSLMVWFMLCFSAAWWLIPLSLAFHNVRKPLIEEEQVMHTHFSEVKDRAQDYRPYRLLIEERKEIGAFAMGHNTIVLSRGTLKLLEPAEIKAVLAHELGHLRTKDTVASAAIYLGQLSATASLFVIQKFFRMLKGIFRLAAAHCLIAPLIIVMLIPDTALLSVLGFTFRGFLFAYLFSKLSLAFSFVHRANARFTEYRQDAFAQSLGYGPALKSALLKIIGDEPTDVRVWNTWRFGSHPVTHNRIRRLEKLEGSRTDG